MTSEICLLEVCPESRRKTSGECLFIINIELVRRGRKNLGAGRPKKSKSKRSDLGKQLCRWGEMTGNFMRRNQQNVMVILTHPGLGKVRNLTILIPAFLALSTLLSTPWLPELSQTSWYPQICIQSPTRLPCYLIRHLEPEMSVFAVLSRSTCKATQAISERWPGWWCCQQSDWLVRIGTRVQSFGTHVEKKPGLVRGTQL